MRQDEHEQPQIAAPSPHTLSKPVGSKIKRHQRRKSDSSLSHKDPTRYPNLHGWLRLIPQSKCRAYSASVLANETGGLSMIDGISAVTLGTHEMPRAVRFYRALGFEILHGGEESSFTSFRAGASYLNLIAQPAGRCWSWWGRVIFYVADVDELYDRALAAGCQPTTAPRDAEWSERFFHLVDPDGHELSFARLLRPPV